MTFANAIQPITSTFSTAIGKPMKGTFLALTRQIIFLLPLIVVLPMIFGIDGIMYAAPIADGGAAVISIIVIRGIFRKMGE
jgi:Na+-driven multidrug efflux pump